MKNHTRPWLGEGARTDELHGGAKVQGLSDESSRDGCDFFVGYPLDNILWWGFRVPFCGARGTLKPGG